MARKTADQYETEQQAEWSKYTAKVPIDFYGVRAYNPGDPVPASAVDGDAAWIPPELVDTSAAYQGSQTVPPPEPPTIDPTAVAAPAASTPTPTES
jgi:hypothetical protein